MPIIIFFSNLGSYWIPIGMFPILIWNIQFERHVFTYGTPGQNIKVSTGFKNVRYKDTVYVPLKQLHRY